jgi:putative salt-induced outer membrane protein YdiY
MGAASLASSLVGLIALAGAASGAMAPPSVEPPQELVEAESFEPRPAGSSGPDWIRLESGEWLQGSLDRIRDGSLDFDSDELDELHFDLGDVYAVLTSGPHTLSLEGRRILSGEIAIRGDEVRIRTSDGVRSCQRSEVIGMVPGNPREINYWSGKVSLGLSLQRGNTDQTDFTALGNLMRETALTRASAKYNGTGRTVGGSSTANNHRASAQGDLFLTRRFYVTVASFEYFTDDFQNIDPRLTPAAGIGYKVVDRSRTEVSIALAGGAQYTRDLTPALPGGSLDRTTASIIMSMAFETDPTERIEWDGQYKVQLGVPDTSETNHHALTTVSIDVWGNMDLDLTFVWDRNQSPAVRSHGSVPLQDDYRLSAGLGWDS